MPSQQTPRQVSLRAFKEHYLRLVESIYTKEQIYATFRSRLAHLNRVTEFFLDHLFFHLVSPDACVLVMVHQRDAYFGFVESRNPESLERILQAAQAIAQQFNVRRLLGPVNFTLWHSYGWKESSLHGQELCGGRFWAEPANPSFYSDVALKSGFTPHQRWISCTQQASAQAARRDQTNLMYEFKRVNLSLLNWSAIGKGYRMARRFADQSPDFIHPSLWAFLLMCIQNAKLSQVGDQYLYTLIQDNHSVGFISTQLDNRSGIPQLVVKAIIQDGIQAVPIELPPFQNIVHTIALQLQCQSIYYSLLGNNYESKTHMIPHLTSVSKYYTYQYLLTE